MERKLITYSKMNYKKLVLQTHCLLLLVKNLLLIRILKIRSVSLYDRVVIQDNEIEILWNVRGCHKIIINRVGVFPGNTHGLKFMFSNRQNPIEITFCGISKKIKKKIQIKNTKINLLNKFIAITEIPIVFEVTYNKQKFQCELIKDNLKMELQNISFEFEPFNIDNYKPVNTIQ
ncbi:MAG: hypothetical protein Q8R57_16745 [Bacteroidota bacterium]|nr:hypothetical protein [Bacteroidota bacterium]